VDEVIVNVVSRMAYRARLAASPPDLDRALSLRQRCFRPHRPEQSDSDSHDPLCRHLMIDDVATGDLIAYCRFLILKDGGDISASYAARYYNLTALTDYPDPMMEIGRFCMAPDSQDPLVLRLAWAALTAFVDRFGVKLLFGCSSFSGASDDRHRKTLSVLTMTHPAPERWAPARKAGVALLRGVQDRDAGVSDIALVALPPLLRSYLAMGGWVSDHAVIDHDLDTIHVFTALEIAAIPAARAQALRAMAATLNPGDISDD
jgi:L-ornithine Nalpha-acyltransferase